MISVGVEVVVDLAAIVETVRVAIGGVMLAKGKKAEERRATLLRLSEVAASVVGPHNLKILCLFPGRR